jgi:hypothetical protein
MLEVENENVRILLNAAPRVLDCWEVRIDRKARVLGQQRLVTEAVMKDRRLSLT